MPLWDATGAVVSLAGTQPGSARNWEKEAGDLWRNGVVGICLKFLADTFPEAPIQVERDKGDGTVETIPDHPLARLFLAPPLDRVGGAILPPSALWAGVLLSLAVDGNAYLILRRDRIGRPAALEYVPHWAIEPQWTSAEQFISHYRYRYAGGEMKLETADVIHFRDGLDPQNSRKGISPLKSLLREIVSDNEATGYTAAILGNMGIPGCIITPPKDVLPKPDFIKRTKELWSAFTAGERRGDAIVFQDAFDVKAPGFSPEQLALDKIRRVPEARICAALRIPPMVVGLTTGDGQRTYSNMREAREMVEESTIIPLYARIAETLTLQLLPQLSMRPGERVCFDLSAVRVLQQDMNELYQRVTLAYQAGILTRGESRSLLGREAVAGRDDGFASDYVGGTAANEAIQKRLSLAAAAAKRRADFEAGRETGGA